MSEKLEHFKSTMTAGLAVIAVLILLMLTIYITGNYWIPSTFVLMGFPAYGAWRLVQAREVSSWELVPAYIEAAQVLSRSVPGEHVSIKEHYPVIRLRHEVGGVSVISECYSRFPRDFAFHDAKKAHELLEPYPVGSVVEVYRNPKNPREVSVVERISPKRRSHYLAISIGGCIAAIVLVAFGGGFAL